LYEGGIRVPFIARWTGTIEAGRRSDHISAFWDFLPTACELANTEIPTETDGISYLPELLGKPQTAHESLYFEFHEQGGKQAIIEGDWKLIRLNVNDSLRTITELYNLKNDSSEQENLAETQIYKVTDLIEMMELKRTKNENFYFEFEKNPN
jgi:arylsulfatase A-like enzyme